VSPREHACCSCRAPSWGRASHLEACLSRGVPRQRAHPRPLVVNHRATQLPTSLSEVGARHRSSLGGNLRARSSALTTGWYECEPGAWCRRAGAANGYVLMTGPRPAWLAGGPVDGRWRIRLPCVRSARCTNIRSPWKRDEVAEYPEEESGRARAHLRTRARAIEQARELSRDLLYPARSRRSTFLHEKNSDSIRTILGSQAGGLGFFLAFAGGAAKSPAAFYCPRIRGEPLTATVVLTCWRCSASGWS